VKDILAWAGGVLLAVLLGYVPYACYQWGYKVGRREGVYAERERWESDGEQKPYLHQSGTYFYSVKIQFEGIREKQAGEP